MTLTEIAKVKIREISESEEIGHLTVRVKVVGGGCAGFTHDMMFDDIVDPLDEIVEIDGIKVLIDPVSFTYLENVEIDYTESTIGSGFKFINPSATGSCGCRQLCIILIGENNMLNIGDKVYILLDLDGHRLNNKISTFDKLIIAEGAISKVLNDKKYTVEFSEDSGADSSDMSIYENSKGLYYNTGSYNDEELYGTVFLTKEDAEKATEKDSLDKEWKKIVNENVKQLNKGIALLENSKTGDVPYELRNKLISVLYDLGWTSSSLSC